MKELYKYISMFFVGMAFLSSCADENEIVPVEEKKPERAVVRLNFQRQADREVINSRATDAENKLYDLHFYVFNAKGELTGYTKMESAEGEIPSPGPEEVTIDAMTGESYIYAVANINKSTSYYLSDADEQLLNVTNVAGSKLTRDDFLDIEFKRRYGNEGSELFSPNPAGDIFIMSGYLNDGNSVTIQKNGTDVSIEENVYTIYLYRILAKNTLTINSNVANGEFTPKYYRLCNVPVGGMLIPNADISKVNQYTSNNVTGADVESSYRWNFNGDTEISFYYPENLRKAKSGASIGDWKDREKNSWSNNEKTFTNADDDAAYIEIHGDYTANDGKVTANVSYTIHFGDFSNKGSVYDFNVIRNHAYTYEVTVKGVDDIEVEAKEEEDNPYAEGLIIEAEGGVAYDVDAHYEARVMAFTKTSIQQLKAANNDQPGYIVNVKTPFGETNQTVYVKDDGVYNISGDKLCDLDNVSEIFTGEDDYQWMRFVRNTTENRMANDHDISKYPCKYPGDDHCLNVFELLAELYDENTYGSDETIYYTCFVDENYYAGKSWPEYTNKDPRIMLIANDLNVSADGKSLYAKVAYSISQRSIATFYVSDFSNKKAFGTEIIDEEDKYSERFSRKTIGNIVSLDDWKARTSAVATNQNGEWYSTDVNYVENSQPLYSTVAKACMSRNRDLDGNGKIQGEEVKWYLAAVEQYRALVYGQGSYDSDANLISQDELKSINRTNGGNLERARFHYFSASEGTKFIFWPEEGLSTSADTQRENGVYDYGDAQLVRCIRTLDSENEGLSEPESFYTYDSSTRTFELDGIKATRQAQKTPLKTHNELSYENGNGLYSSFVVASQDLSGTYSANTVTGSDNDPCRNYSEGGHSWRTPNQKEFSLMLSEDIATSGSYAIRTDFSGTAWKSTNGFWSDNGRINVDTNGSTRLKIRCVRDNI